MYGCVYIERDYEYFTYVFTAQKFVQRLLSAEEAVDVGFDRRLRRRFLVIGFRRRRRIVVMELLSDLLHHRLNPSSPA